MEKGVCQKRDAPLQTIIGPKSHNRNFNNQQERIFP
jgi:hypothetical protein